MLVVCRSSWPTQSCQHECAHSHVARIHHAVLSWDIARTGHRDHQISLSDSIAVVASLNGTLIQTLQLP